MPGIGGEAFFVCELALSSVNCVNSFQVFLNFWQYRHRAFVNVVSMKQTANSPYTVANFANILTCSEVHTPVCFAAQHVITFPQQCMYMAMGGTVCILLHEVMLTKMRVTSTQYWRLILIRAQTRLVTLLYTFLDLIPVTSQSSQPSIRQSIMSDQVRCS